MYLIRRDLLPELDIPAHLIPPNPDESDSGDFIPADHGSY